MSRPTTQRMASLPPPLPPPGVRFRDLFAGYEGLDRLRRLVIGAYAVTALGSVAWSASFWAAQRVQRLLFDVGQTEQGSVFLTVHNDTSKPWTKVLIDADDQYLLRVERVPAYGTVECQMSDFTPRFGIPRQPGLSLWEGAAPVTFPGASAPRDHRPTQLRIESEQGIFSARIEP